MSTLYWASVSGMTRASRGMTLRRRWNRGTTCKGFHRPVKSRSLEPDRFPHDVRCQTTVVNSWFLSLFKFLLVMSSISKSWLVFQLLSLVIFQRSPLIGMIQHSWGGRMVDIIEDNGAETASMARVTCVPTVPVPIQNGVSNTKPWSFEEGLVWLICWAKRDSTFNRPSKRVWNMGDETRLHVY